jgi:hypothetical protein
MSVDVVFTPDKTKWSKCIVVEEQSEAVLSQGGAAKFDMRKANSKDTSGNEIQTETGGSWFPGYAINPETGERLNVFFGEDSWLISQNGRDMLWDPTSAIEDPTFNNIWVGGKNYLYITSARYDSCNNFVNLLNAGNITSKRNVYKTVRWCTLPLLAEGFHFNSIEDFPINKD